MTSEYLKNTRSLEELDKFLEKDRSSAAKIAAAAFRHDLISAVSNIGEINQVASARILADSQVASAKIMTDAEITSTLILTSAEMALLEIQEKMTGEKSPTEIARSMISEVTYNTRVSISKSAEDSVKAIQQEAEEAIRRIKENAKKAIDDIHELAEDIDTRISKNAEDAAEKLLQAKVNARSPEELVKNAEEAAEKVVSDGSLYRSELRDMVTKVTGELNATTDSALKMIAEAVEQSEKRIIQTRENVLTRIDEIISAMLPE